MAHTAEPTEIRLPGNAIDHGKGDVAGPALDLLHTLNLCPSEGDLEKADGPGALLAGPPQSVAVIEAGATALSKWWATGLGGTVIGAWTAITTLWGDLDDELRSDVVLAAAIASAALILAIGVIISSDVRGRALATVATVEARSRIAETVIREAEGRPGPLDEPTRTITPLPAGLRVKFLRMRGDDEAGWMAIAVQTTVDGSEPKFLVVKGADQKWAESQEVEFLD